MRIHLAEGQGRLREHLLTDLDDELEPGHVLTWPARANLNDTE